MVKGYKVRMFSLGMVTKGIGGKLLGFVAVVGMGSGLFLMRPSITGGTIMSSSIGAASFVGAGLLVVGLASSFLWVKGKK